MRPKIAHLITDLDIGGTEKSLVSVATGLKPFVDQRVFSLCGTGALQGDLEVHGIPVSNLNMPRGRPSANGFGLALKSLREYQPDLIQTWLYHADLLGLLASRFVGSPPLVWNLRCTELVPETRSLTSGIIRNVLAMRSSRTSAVVSNSQAAIEVHERLGYRPPKWVHIPNGIDLDVFHPRRDSREMLRKRLNVADNEILVGQFGRVDPNKDHSTLFSATSALLDEGVPLKLLIVGNNSTALGGDVWSAGIQDSTILQEAVHDIQIWYSALDVFVLSSWSEGMPNVVGEAMASGVPCIGTNVGDVATMINDRNMIVEAGDTVAMTAALRAVSSWPDTFRIEQGMKVQTRARERFSRERMLSKYRGLYREIMA